MQTLLPFITWLAVIAWLGGMIFFSFILTPTLFKQVPRDMVGKVLEALFPKYYFLGYVCGVAALLTQLLAGAKPAGGWNFYLLKLALLGGMVTATYYAGLIVYPEAHRLKTEMRGKAETDVAPETRAQFKKTHRFSVLLNLVAMLLGLAWVWCAVRAASAPPPLS